MDGEEWEEEEEEQDVALRLGSRFPSTSCVADEDINIVNVTTW